MIEPIIRTANLTFDYGSKPILKGVNLAIPANSIFGFLGSNGAGKSTTIKLLLGLLPAGADKIFMFNQDISKSKFDILSNVGCLIESPAQYFHLTAMENLNYLDLLFNKGKTRKEEVLRTVGLWNDRNKKVKQFSTGMKQRLGIAKAIFHNPEVIILDEPMNGLDPHGISQVRDILQVLQQQGKTIFLSSHLLGEVEKICTSVAILDSGQLVYQGVITELVARTTRTVTLVTNNNHAALTLMLQHNLHAKLNEQQTLELQVKDGNEFNKVIYLLTQKQLEVYNIATTTPTLEDVYLNITAQPKAHA